MKAVSLVAMGVLLSISWAWAETSPATPPSIRRNAVLPPATVAHLKFLFQNSSPEDFGAQLLSPSALKGEARLEFKEMGKKWGPDHAPNAFLAHVDGASIVVIE